MIQVKQMGRNDWWCEWRNHEANLQLDGGRWSGDMIAYGEWGDLEEPEAEAVAYAFGLTDWLSPAAHDMFEFYFGGNKVVA